MRDASITQEGKTVRLSLVIIAGTSKNKAIELGDSFIRAVKSYNASEPSPEKEIGRGIYNYQVFVFSQTEQLLAFGSKFSNLKSIIWR